MKSFFGNDTIVILFLGAGFLAGIYSKQTDITLASGSALAGFLGGKFSGKGE